MASRKRYARMAEKASPPVERKPCGRCGEEKPADKFSPYKRSSTGLSSWCKVCATPLKHVHVANAFC